MPVRKIPKSFRAVTGRFPSMINGRCIGYESKLERDYYLKLEFDPNVKSYEEQPVKVYGTVNGRNVTYVLDCLIAFKNSMPSRLVEIKYSDELQKRSFELELKFERCRKYAEESGLEFVVVTEKDVYDVALKNYRLLYRFAKPHANMKIRKDQILKKLKDAGPMTLKDLLQSLDKERGAQVSYSPVIWHMLYTREIEADLNSPIGYSSLLRVYHGENLIP